MNRVHVTVTVPIVYYHLRVREYCSGTPKHFDWGVLPHVSHFIPKDIP